MARGSVFRKDGRWAFRVDAGFHADSGKRRQVLRQGFAAKRAAEAALAETIGDASRGAAVSASALKVGTYSTTGSSRPDGRCARPLPTALNRTSSD